MQVLRRVADSISGVRHLVQCVARFALPGMPSVNGARQYAIEPQLHNAARKIRRSPGSLCVPQWIGRLVPYDADIPHTSHVCPVFKISVGFLCVAQR
jgi:hypothetical protein